MPQPAALIRPDRHERPGPVEQEIDEAIRLAEARTEAIAAVARLRRHR